MNVLVVGAGAMGRWFAETVVTDGDDLAFVDTDPAVAKAAAETLGGRAIEGDVGDEFDLVCVAVPLPAAADVIREYADHARGAICDVSGTMDEPVAAMAEAGPELERISLHPLFAAENAPGTVAAVFDAKGSVGERVRDRLEAAGNRVVETTPAEHDEAMETVQAKAHAAVLAFGLAADPVPEPFHTPISSALLDLVEQVTAGEARVYSDIQTAFEGADEVAAAARAIAEADPDTFETLYERLQ